MATRITAARVYGPGRLELTFDRADTRVVDLAPLIARGNLYGKLADLDFLSDMQLMYEGLFIQWPEDFDIAADTLWDMALEQQALPRKRKIG